MKILAIDTSGEIANAAILTENMTIGEVSLNARQGEKAWTHSEILMPAVQNLFNSTGLRVQEMDYVAYTSGPGSFTGLRIGASCALGIAKAQNIPAIAVPTLDAMAYNVYKLCNRHIVMPMMDARREQVYFAVYITSKTGITRITEYAALPVTEALKQLPFANPENIIFLGDGADAYHEILQEHLPDACYAPLNNNRQRASGLGLAALEMIASGMSFDAPPELIYVRQPQAVREAAAKQNIQGDAL